MNYQNRIIAELEAGLITPEQMYKMVYAIGFYDGVEDRLNGQIEVDLWLNTPTKTPELIDEPVNIHTYNRRTKEQMLTRTNI